MRAAVNATALNMRASPDFTPVSSGGRRNLLLSFGRNVPFACRQGVRRCHDWNGGI